MLDLRFCNFGPVLILAFLSVLIGTRAHGVSDPNSATKFKSCSTQICEETGYEIINSIKTSVNPCDDFYQHVCGNWKANISKPAMLMDPTSQSNILVIKVLQQLRDMLEDMLKDNEMENETLRKVRDFYSSCKNTDALVKRGLSVLTPILSANGGWPAITEPGSWDLEKQKLTLQKIHENYATVYSRSAFYLITVVPDQGNPRHNLLHWGQPNLNFVIPAMRYFTPRAIKRDTVDTTYIEYAEVLAQKLAELQGSNVTSDDISVDIANLLEFGAQLDTFYGPISKAEYDSRTFYKVTTIAEVQDTWNKAVAGRPDLAFDWLGAIRSEFKGTNTAIVSTDKIVLSRRRIVEQLAELVKKTPLRTVVNFIHWQAINELAVLTEQQENDDEEQSLFCTDYHRMREGLSYAYVHKYYKDNSSLLPIQDMISQLQVELKGLFDQSTWMDDEAKLKFKGKVDSMIKNVGYPSWYEKPGKIDEYYSTLEIGPNYFENVVNFNRFERMEMLKKLRKPFNRNNARWPINAITVGVTYTSPLNAISVPAVSLQTPFYSVERPLVMNYGSLGTLIGHAASGAFGKTGLMFDKDGDKKSLLSKSSTAKYIEKAKCLVDQYSKYSITDRFFRQTVNISGEETLGDTIADHTSIRIGLRAYLSYKKAHNFEDVRIPVLKDYTDEKLFFYSLGNRFCTSGAYSDLPYYWNYRTIPAQTKLNAALYNMPEFSEAFNCPSGSPMNPENKCNLWA